MPGSFLSSSNCDPSLNLHDNPHRLGTLETEAKLRSLDQGQAILVRVIYRQVTWKWSPDTGHSTQDSVLPCFAE